MQDEVANRYYFEEYSIPKKEDLDSSDTVYTFRITSAADIDVGGEYSGPGNFVEIPRREQYHEKSYTKYIPDPDFYVHGLTLRGWCGILSYII